MVRYKLTNRAVEDLTHIWNYTLDKWSENQADKYSSFATKGNRFKNINSEP